MSQPDGPFTRAASVIADLDSPFYAEERQRDVWNEASAVGFQTLIWLMFGLVGAMVWIGGRSMFGWALTLLLLTGLASGLTIVHANRLGVTGWEGARMRRPRLLLAGLLIGLIGLGVLVRTDFDLSPSTIAGAVVGFVAALAGAAGAAWLVRRQARAEEPDADQPDDALER